MSHQSPISLFLEYLNRLIRRWVVVFFAVGGGVTLINEILTGNRLVTWVAIVMIIASLLIAGYQVFVPEYREKRALQERLDEISSRIPDVEVYFLDAGERVTTLPVRLGPAPPAPQGIDVEGAEILSSRDESRRNLYIWETAKARLREVTFGVHNAGAVDAENVRLDFALPKDILTAESKWVGAYYDDDPPEPPGKPDPIYGSSLNFPMMRPDVSWTMTTGLKPDPEGPHYEDKSRTFTYRPGTLVPGVHEDQMDSVPLLFGAVEDGRTYPVTVKIQATGLNPPKVQELWLEIFC
jgi:hypothetical protein